QVRDAIRRWKTEDRVVAERGVAGLEQQLIGRGHRPERLIDVERRVEVAARRRRRRFRRLERQCVVAEADPGVAALVAALRVDLQRRAFAAMLVFGIEREAVPSNLAGEAADEYLAVLHQTRVDRG